jgi:hypothetical protein
LYNADEVLAESEHVGKLAPIFPVLNIRRHVSVTGVNRIHDDVNMALQLLSFVPIVDYERTARGGRSYFE